jgi:hypothetical protein
MQAKMLGTGDEQTHNARSGSKVSGTPWTRMEFYNAEFSLEPSLHFFTTTAKRLAKREHLHFSAFKRRVAVRTKATSLDGCVAL